MSQDTAASTNRPGTAQVNLRAPTSFKWYRSIGTTKEEATKGQSFPYLVADDPKAIIGNSTLTGKLGLISMSGSIEKNRLRSEGKLGRWDDRKPQLLPETILPDYEQEAAGKRLSKFN